MRRRSAGTLVRYPESQEGARESLVFVFCCFSLYFQLFQKNNYVKFTQPSEVLLLIITRIPNVCVSLRILLTIPTTVASAERSFIKLKLITNFLRSTMSQTRPVDLARLSIESSIATEINFDSVIRNFADKKAS